MSISPPTTTEAEPNSIPETTGNDIRIPSGESTHEPIDTHENPASATQGIPIHKHGVGMWGGPRIVANFRCDEKIWIAFKPFSKRYFGSTCKAMESILVALMTPTIMGQDNGYTQGITGEVNGVPLLSVGALHIHRNLRGERRNLEPDEVLPLEVGESGAPMVELAAPYINYYVGRGSLNPSSADLMKVIKRDLPELDGGQRVILVKVILRKVAEGRK